MSKKIMISSIFLAILIFCASISGVFATWFFAEETPTSVMKAEDIGISEFVWKPEEILPDVTPGQNYLDLHESILENTKGGLNSSKDTLENLFIIFISELFLMDFIISRPLLLKARTLI